MLKQMFQDVRFALRQLRKSPAFTVTAVVTLALGIGANTAIFTLVQGVLLRSLPVADPAQLYRIGDTDDCCVNGGFVGENGDFDIFSYDLFKVLRGAAPEFQSLAAVQAGQWQWSVRRGNALPRELRGEFVTGNYFSTLGVGSYMGRVFSEADDQQNSPPVVVLSYRSWQNEFGGEASIVGQTVFIQTHPFTVVGVAPPPFFGDRVSDSPPDFWLPVNQEPYARGEGSILHHAELNWLYPIGRVRQGANIPALQAKLSAALRNWMKTMPVYTDHGGAAEIPKQHVVVVPGGGGIQNMQQETGTGLKMLMILSSVVLIIACANIANLLLARSTTRHGDIAVRMAMGAGRRRIIRQIITESVLLSCMGGLAGLGVAYAGSRSILSLAFPDARNLPIQASPSLEVLGFAFLVSLLTGVLFGLGPAWLSSHAQPAEVLRGSGRSTRDSSSLPQKLLVISQAALSLVLIAGAFLMSKSLNKLEHQDFGITTANRYVLRVDPAGAGYKEDRLDPLYRNIEDRFSSLPGVASVGLAMYSPLAGNNWGECVIQQGHPAPGPNDKCGSTWDRVGPQFLDSIGVPIVRGRGITSQDTQSSQPVAIVNQAFVKRFYPKEDPIGKHFGIDLPQYSGAFEIVGVFRDFKMNNPRSDTRPVFLRPLAQTYEGYKTWPGGGARPPFLDAIIGVEGQSRFIDAIIVSFRAPQQNAEELLRRTLTSIDPNLTVVDIHTYDAQVASNFTQDRLLARLTTLFGILALILASVGLYGVTSYFVARRAGEIGIRMALGATRSMVIRSVMRGALVQIAAGLAIGIPAAVFAGHLMRSQLYGVGANDPYAIAGAALILVACALVAGLIPARRAASIEPMQALRTE